VNRLHLFIVNFIAVVDFDGFTWFQIKDVCYVSETRWCPF